MNKSFFSIVWIMIEKFGAVLISTVSFLVYSFYLSPAELGVATIVLSIVLGISQTVVTLFQDPLIIKKRLFKKDVSSCLFFNVGLSLALCGLILVNTVIFASSYEQIILMAVASLVIPISAISSIYLGVLRRLHRFKSLAIRTLIGRLTGAIVGSSFAIWGFGAISMIAQIIVIELFGLIGMMLAVRIRPSHTFEFSSIKILISQGLVLAARKFSWEACVKGIPILLAIVSNPYLVGVFAFAWRLVDMPRVAIHSGAMSFVLPFLVKSNKGTDGLSRGYVKANKITMLIICPLFIGFALCAEPLITLIYDDKWNDAIPLFQALCFITVLNSTRIYGPTLFTSMSLPAIGLKTDILSTTVTLVLVVILFDYVGILSIAIALIARAIINYPINAVRVKQYLKLSFTQQIAIFAPYLFSSMVMATVLLIIDSFSQMEGGLLLLCQILAGVVVYTACIWFFDRATLNYLIKRENNE